MHTDYEVTVAFKIDGLRRCLARAQKKNLISAFLSFPLDPVSHTAGGVPFARVRPPGSPRPRGASTRALGA